ncbi:hypothetical protein Golax_024437 [Gossypium laxum]|uniref:CCHC-type domain-containing protein n=1 Tax=Gossypium laxum TaxID=34288 RepID=A0A7J8ZCV3_9ROSI|nr:hypothetical protein [Gossypium laxum]
MSFSSTSFERPGSPVPEDLTRATKNVKNKSIDDQVLGDVVMKDGLPNVSCRDKFVGNVVGRGSKEEAVLEQELEITEDDYMINTEGEYLKITFFERIHERIDKSMAKTTVVRLLGKNIGYKALKDYDNALTGGPWVIYGHYLVVKPWSRDFTTRESFPSKMVVWVRFSRLRYRYYSSGLLRIISKILGEIIKVDYNTTKVKREQFAGLAVMIDLKKPLVSRMGVDGHIQYMEYEGLLIICYECGCYGHNKESCLKLQNKGKEADSTEQTMVQASESVADTTVGAEKALG